MKYQPKMPSGQYYSKSKSGKSRHKLDRLTYDVMDRDELEHFDTHKKQKYRERQRNMGLINGEDHRTRNGTESVQAKKRK